MVENEFIERIRESKPFLISLPGSKNDSGELRYWENKLLFQDGIKRCFWVFEVEENKARGNHAHKTENQVIIAIHGEIEAHIINRKGEDITFVLNHPSQALFIPPLHWISTKFGSSAVLLGMTNETFSEEDYIRDRSQFDSL